MTQHRATVPFELPREPKRRRRGRRGTMWRYWLERDPDRARAWAKNARRIRATLREIRRDLKAC